MRTLRYLLAALALCLLPVSAEAATCYWVAGTSWNSSASWSATDVTATGGTCAATSGIPKNAGDVANLATAAPAATTLLVDVTLSIATISCNSMTGGSGLDGNGFNITLSAGLLCTGTGTRSVTLGNGSTWTITQGVGSTAWDFTTVTGLTFTSTGSTVNFTGTGGATIRLGNSLSYNVVGFGTTSGGQYSLLSPTATPDTIATMNVTAPANIICSSCKINVTNAPVWTGTSANPISLEVNSIALLGFTIATSGSPTCDWCVFRGITVSGATMDATNSLSLGSLSGITVHAPSGGGGGFIIGGG